jgi:PII-like signaling protein
MFNENGCLLRIFIEEQMRHGNHPLYEWIVRQALEHNLAGATVLRGMEGFGADHHIHHASLLTMTFNLPVIVEIVDTPEKINEFIPVIENEIDGGLITVENIHMRILPKTGQALH